jgi:DNA polymerase elongation subunit (family B)
MFNNVIVEFTDIRDTKDNVNTFNRVIKGETLSYVNGVKVGSFRNDTKFISKIDKSSDFIFNVITMDLETRTINNGLEAISNAIYDGEDYKTFFITDYKNSEEMLRDSLKYLMQDKYNNHHIYLHNFSKFDGIFLLRIIANLDAKVNVLIRDNNLLNISITFEDISILDGEDKTNKCTIHFHDSLLLLPSSLEKLAKNFGVESKGSFDFKKINQATTNDQLNLIRDKLLDYNKQDCLVLYQVMKEFAVNIFHLYSLNIINYPTISSLSFAIFRSNFMKEEIIPISNLKDYNFIKESYRGGHVDVYRPFTKKGRKVYCYDINSLYPFVMANNLFPTGIPKYFYGSRDLNDIFGFVKVNVTCPNNMFCPVLLTRINDKTIAPIGQ